MKLYIYDHCPYCVKARMIFGFKNVKVELVTLLNDDEALPIKMIGQKMVPILATENGDYMAETKRARYW
jgi:glutaredoxin 2